MSGLTHEHLRDHLGICWETLRRANDSFNYVNCLVILGLLLLKRSSESSEVHRTGRPTIWTKITQLSNNIIDGIDRALSELGRANPSSFQIFQDVKLASSSHVFGSVVQADRLLSEVIVILSNLDLSDTSLGGADALGRACEDLIEMFDETLGKKGHDVLIPPSLSRLLVELLDLEEKHHVCDPACGVGGNLIASARYVAEKSYGTFDGEVGITLHGQEWNRDAWAVCNLNLLLHGITNFRVENGDVIAEPKLIKDGELICYDRVLLVSPFGHKVLDRHVLEKDRHRRFHGRPSVRGESAFVQHVVASLNDDGRAGVVVSHGALFRGSSDADVRKELVKMDVIEAVIGLPSNLFSSTAIPAVILVLNRNKHLDRRGKVLFIDASKGYEPCTGKNKLRLQDAAQIVNAYRAWRDEGRYCRVVLATEIEAAGFSMSINRYVAEYDGSGDDTIKMLASLAEAELERDAAAVRMDELLEEFGIRIRA